MLQYDARLSKRIARSNFMPIRRIRRNVGRIQKTVSLLITFRKFCVPKHNLLLHSSDKTGNFFKYVAVSDPTYACSTLNVIPASYLQHRKTGKVHEWITSKREGRMNSMKRPKNPLLSDDLFRASGLKTFRPYLESHRLQ